MSYTHCSARALSYEKVALVVVLLGRRAVGGAQVRGEVRRGAGRCLGSRCCRPGLQGTGGTASVSFLDGRQTSRPAKNPFQLWGWETGQCVERCGVQSGWRAVREDPCGQLQVPGGLVRT